MVLGDVQVFHCLHYYVLECQHPPMTSCRGVINIEVKNRLYYGTTLTLEHVNNSVHTLNLPLCMNITRKNSDSPRKLTTYFRQALMIMILWLTLITQYSKVG